MVNLIISGWDMNRCSPDGVNVDIIKHGLDGFTRIFKDLIKIRVDPCKSVKSVSKFN